MNEYMISLPQRDTLRVQMWQTPMKLRGSSGEVTYQVGNLKAFETHDKQHRKDVSTNAFDTPSMFSEKEVTDK